MWTGFKGWKQIPSIGLVVFWGVYQVEHGLRRDTGATLQA